MFTRLLEPIASARRQVLVLCLAVMMVATVAAADSKGADSKPAQQPMSRQTRMLVIRSLNAEFVFVRYPLPMGLKGVTVQNGKVVSPDQKELEILIATYGPAAKVGERAQITGVEFKDSNKILFEINGGPKKKTKWYQRVQVGSTGGAAQLPDDGAKNPKGSLVELRFDKYVPEMTGDQIRELLSPVLDFKSHSAAEAYLDTVPPKIKNAIKNHEVLVGMNREMVGYSKGRPDKKIREVDANGRPYEEWLYGQPPKEVQFVRFDGDQVVRLEIMKVDGEKVVRTEKEVDIQPVVAAKQETDKKAAEKSAQDAHKPTLRRPGEPEEPAATGGANTPDDKPAAPPPRDPRNPG